jgi:hypothetical protein
VDKPWGINTVGGCCGVTGLPFADSEKSYDELREASEKEMREGAASRRGGRGVRRGE